MHPSQQTAPLRLLLMFVLTFLLALAYLSAGSAFEVKSWLTTADPNTGAAILLLAEQAPISSNSKSDSGGVNINININDIKQTILGYGAGLPQSSAKVLSDLKNRSLELYNSVLHKLFSSDGDGAGMNILRFPMGSCDFSMSITSYDEVKNDYNLDSFSIDEDSLLIVNVLKDIMQVNPKLILIATPWSAPSWLKEWNEMIAYSEKNTLFSTDQAYQTYAQYFAKTLRAYKEQGLNIQYFTLQNEPLFGNGDQYPGMYFDSAQAAKLGPLVHNLLGGEAKLLAYDHNWDVPSYPLDVLSTTPSGTFAGTAWHCYGGDMATAMEEMHSQHPDLPQHVTECTGGYPDGVCDITKGMEGFGWNHEWDMSNILIGAAAHWSSSGVKWILALDEHCGPTLPKVTFTNGRPLVAIPSWASTEKDIQYNQDFYSIKHMSKFLVSGASQAGNTTATATAGATAAAVDGSTVRVGTAIKPSDGTDTSNLILESFYNEKTHLVTVIAMNKDHSNALSIHVDQGQGVSFGDSLPPFSTKVYQWIKK